MSETPPSGPPWWQTLPGIMTGLAAVITAVTGLVVAFNHTSTSTTRTEEPRPSPQPQAAAAAPASPPPSSPSRRPASAAAAPSIAVPSIDRVKLAGGDAVITILSAQIEPI